MNNVLNRKMFVNRDARAKLANMGGILQSSPEMANITQKFAPGGKVGQQVSDGRTGSFKPDPSFMDRLFESLMVKVRNNEPFTKQESEIFEEIASQDDQLRDSIIASRDQGAAMGEFGAAGAIGDIPDRKPPVGSESFSQAVTDQIDGDTSLEGITGTEAYRFIRGDTDSEGFIDSLMPPASEQEIAESISDGRIKAMMNNLAPESSDPRDDVSGFGSDLLSQEMLDAEQARADQSRMRLPTGDREASSSYLGPSSEVRKDPQEVISRDQRIAGEDMAFDPRDDVSGFGSDLLRKPEALSGVERATAYREAQSKAAKQKVADENREGSLEQNFMYDSMVDKLLDGRGDPRENDPRGAGDGFGSDLLRKPEALSSVERATAYREAQSKAAKQKVADENREGSLEQNFMYDSMVDKLLDGRGDPRENDPRGAGDGFGSDLLRKPETLSGVERATAYREAQSTAAKQKVADENREDSLEQNPMYDNEIARIMGGTEYRDLEIKKQNDLDRKKRIAEEDLAMSMPLPEKPFEGERNNRFDSLALVIADTNEAIKKDPEDALNIATDNTLNAAGVNTTGMTTKQRVAAQRKLLDELRGGTNEAQKEQFWMNMAMVGFQIASGESPDALTNISKGLLSFAMQTKEDDRTRRSDEKELDKLAIAREFESTEGILDRESREYIAKVNAGARKKEETTIEKARRQLYEKNFLSTLKDLTENYPNKQAENIAKAKEGARLAVEAIYPSANAVASSSGLNDGKTNTERNFAAAQAGETTFFGMQGGKIVKFKVDKKLAGV